MPLPLIQPVNRLPQGKVLHPVFLPVLLITDLIHHVKGIPTLRINRLKQTHRILNGIHSIYNGFFINTDFLGDFRDSRLLQIIFYVSFFGINCPVSNITQGAAHSYTVIVTEITPDFSNDHRHCISRKFYIQCSVKIVDGLNQPNTPDLKKIIHIFTAP